MECTVVDNRLAMIYWWDGIPLETAVTVTTQREYYNFI